MDVTNLHRLLEEQKQALDENDRKVDQWYFLFNSNFILILSVFVVSVIVLCL